MKNKKYVYGIIVIACCLLFQGCDGLNVQPSDIEEQLLGSTQQVSVQASSAKLMTGTIPTGTYKLVSWVSWADNADKTVGVVDSSLADLAQIEQRTFLTNQGQEWFITDLGNGEYKIVNVNSGKALDVLYGLTDPGTPLVQYPYSGNNSQKWIIEYQDYGVYRIKSKMDTDMGAHIDSASTANGTNIVLEEFVGSGPMQGAGYFFISPVAYKDDEVTSFFQRTSGWTAGDGANTIPLSDNRVLWLMDDSHIDDYSGGTASCGLEVNNAVLEQPLDNWNWNQTTTHTGPGTTSFADSNPDPDYFHWISTGVQLSDTVYIFSSNLKYDTTGIETAGPPLWSKVEYSNLTVEGYHQLQDFGDIKFGRGFVKESDGYVYAFGSRTTFIVADVFVARFPQGNPNADWTFWDGSGWSSSVSNATAIGESANPVPFVNKVQGKYVMFSTELSTGCNMGTEIYVSTSDSPTGPFSEREKIYTIDDRFNGDSPRFYWAKAHPEYINSKDELLVTYDVNNTSGEQALNGCAPWCNNGSFDPDIYRPRGIRVPLQLIDPNL